MKRLPIVLATLAALFAPVAAQALGMTLQIERESGDVYLQTPVLVSQSSAGVKANDYANHQVISDDGRHVAFFSRATNLTDENHDGMFVRDLETNTIELVSLDTNGDPASFSQPLYLDINADGRYVAFACDDQLAAEDLDSWVDVYLRDRLADETILVSTSSMGHSGMPSISADGRYVAFASTSSDLVEGDLNGCADIFVCDMQTQTTICASCTSEGVLGNGDSSRPVISADGHHIAFWTDATNLFAGDLNGEVDLVVVDLDTMACVPVIVDSNGVQGNPEDMFNVDLQADLSSDGSLVVFVSSAPDLVAGDTNGYADVFVHDMTTGNTRRISSLGVGNTTAHAVDCAITADGKYAAFVVAGELTADTYYAGDEGQSVNAFMCDLKTNTLYLCSQKDGHASYGVQSVDIGSNYLKQNVAFGSDAADLADEGLVRDLDIFVGGLAKEPYVCSIPLVTR